MDGPKKGSLLVIFLTVFIDLLGFGMVLPLLPIYAKQFTNDRSGLTIGLLMASFSAMQFLFAPLWGRVSDRIGRRPVLIIGLLGSVVFYALFGVASTVQSLTLLFVARIGAGIAGATISTAQAYIADVTSLEKRAGGMALVGAAFGLGFTFGPLLGFLALSSAQNEASPWPGYAAAILSAVALLLAILKLPESLTPDSQPAEKHWFNFAALRDALRTPSVAPLLITLFVVVFAFANFEMTLSLMVSGLSDEERPEAAAIAVKAQAESPFHFSQRDVCLTYAFIGVSLTFAQGFLVRRLSKKIAEGPLATAGAILQIIGFAGIVYAIQEKSVPILFGMLFVIVCGFALMMPTLSSLISRRSPPTKQGGILGVSQSMNALARIAGPVCANRLLYMNITLPYRTAAGMMGVGLLLVILSTKSGRDYGSTTGATGAGEVAA